MATLGELGEFGVIDAVRGRLKQGSGVLVGPGDDAAVVVAGDARVVISTDMLLEGRHFRRDWSAPADIGRKAAARGMADVAAMGASPTALVVAFAGPPELSADWVVEVVDAMAEEAAEQGASVVGGDTARSDLVVLAVTAIGDLRGAEPVRRSGAQAGNVVAVCGQLGWAEAGLAVLSRGFRSPRALVEAHRRPNPPYAAGPAAARAGATALIDVSDGLLADLAHIATASEVDIDLDPLAFEVPTAMRDVGSALGADPLRWILTGGDDHAMAACFPAGADLPDGFRIIGRVQPILGHAPTVTIGGAAFVGPKGHQHFR